MVQPQLNQRLASLDASFLYLERKETPLHVGSTMIFDGEISFEDFKAMIVTKLPLLPRYQQKVVPAPFNVGHPTWEFDQEFDINRHIFHIQLDAPGTIEQLRQLTEQLQSRLLDRNKPLWEMFVIDGLEGQRSAMISKVHHAMVDGVSGVDLMNAAFDLSPNPTPLPQPKAVAHPKPLPYNVTRRYIDSLVDNAEEAMKSWNLFQKSFLNLTEGLLKDSSNRTAARPASNPLVSLAAPISPMPFNQRISSQRAIAWSIFSFGEARAIRTALGGTVNDVALTVISAAIRRYLEAHGQKTRGSFLRMMVPVSMRREEQRGTLGNLVSVMPTEIPMDIKDPLELYSYVNNKTKELKEAHVAEEFNMVSTLLGVIPPQVQAIATSLLTTSVPLFNIVCTNVPGPQVPLYVLGRKMTASYAYVPIGYATGLTCAIFSYDQKLFFSLTSDTKLMPDLQTSLKPFLEQSFAELRDAAGVTQPKATEPARVRAEVAAIAPKSEVAPELPAITPETVTPEIALTVAEVEVEPVVAAIEESESDSVASAIVPPQEFTSETPLEALAPLSVIEATPGSDAKASSNGMLPKTVVVKAPARKKTKNVKTSVAKEPVALET